MAKLSLEDIQLLNVIEMSTGARANDLVMADENVTIVVQKGDLGKAIGKGGANIARLRQQFGKEIFVVEDSETVKGFLANIFAPVQLKAVNEANEGGKKVAIVTVEGKNKGLAIGRGGEKIKRARLLAKRRFELDDVRVQ